MSQCSRLCFSEQIFCLLRLPPFFFFFFSFVFFFPGFLFVSLCDFQLSLWMWCCGQRRLGGMVWMRENTSLTKQKKFGHLLDVLCKESSFALLMLFVVVVCCCCCFFFFFFNFFFVFVLFQAPPPSANRPPKTSPEEQARRDAGFTKKKVVFCLSNLSSTIFSKNERSVKKKKIECVLWFVRRCPLRFSWEL